jgi:hypothetical protein
MPGKKSPQPISHEIDTGLIRESRPHLPPESSAAGAITVVVAAEEFAEAGASVGSRAFPEQAEGGSAKSRNDAPPRAPGSQGTGPMIEALGVHS